MINLRSIRPLDVKTIADSVVKTNRLVTVEDVRSRPTAPTLLPSSRAGD